MIKINSIFLINAKDKTKRKVFGIIEATSSNEFFEMGQLGLIPEFKVIIWNFEYKGEKSLQFENKTYTVYRTYLRYDNKIELYLTTNSMI